MWMPPDFWADVIAVLTILALLAMVLGGMWFQMTHIATTHG